MNPSAAAADPATDEGSDVDRLAQRLGAVSVTGLDGRAVRMRDLWRDRITANVFVRQYGCLFCHELVANIVQTMDEFRARGARVIFVGNGTPEQARRFAEIKSLLRDGIVLVTDPDRESYRTAEFARSWTRTFAHPSAASAYVRARTTGHRITGVFGDVPQLGGLVVVHPPARVTYTYRSRYAGDHAPIPDVLEALRPQA